MEKNVTDQDWSPIGSTCKKKLEPGKTNTATAQGKKNNFAERQARNPLLQTGDKPSCPLGPSHFGFRMSREESLSTEDLFGTLTHHPPSPHNAPCPIPCSATYDKEYPSLSCQGALNENSSHHSGQAKQSASSSAAFPSSTDITTKRIFPGSLTEDLSRHLTGNPGSTLQNGFAKAELVKTASQPFSILTSSGGKKYQPPTMHGAPSATTRVPESKASNASKISSSILATSASSSLDSSLLPPASPVGILSVPRPAADVGGHSVRVSNSLAMVPSSCDADSDGKQLPSRSSANGFSSTGAAGAEVNSPISVISSFCSATPESGEGGSTSCLATASSGTTSGNGTTVSNLLKLKLAGNSAPKIVSKPGQDGGNAAKAPLSTITTSSTASQFVSTQVAFSVQSSADYPQNPTMSQSSASSLRGATTMAAMNMTHLGHPSHHIPPALHLMPMPHQPPMQAQHLQHSLLPQHHQSPQHPGMHRSGYFNGQKSSMNPNAPPFRPSGDGTMPQPHSDFDGGWDDEATWVKDSDYAPQASHHWSGFNPNAPPFISKAAKIIGSGGVGMEPGDDEYHLSHLSLTHHPLHITTSAAGPRYPYPAGTIATDYDAPVPTDYSSLSTSSRPGPYRISNNVLLPPSKGDPKAEPRKSKSLLLDNPSAVRPMRPPGFEDGPGFAAYEPSRRKARQPCLVCGEESTLECSTCAQIRKRLGVPLRTFFCSTEHQTQAWKQHHEVHLQHPLSGVPSLTKQKQQAILGKSSSDPGHSHEPFSGASSDGTSEMSDTLFEGDSPPMMHSSNGLVAPAADANGASGEESGTKSMANGSMTFSASSEFSPTPASSSQSPEAPDVAFGKYCTPHFFPLRSTISGNSAAVEEVDGPPMAESELESIGNSILNDLDDMMASGQFALSGPSGSLQEQDTGPETTIVALS
eukprot:GGOE01000463.1.p1 GENE.GGOE01000463.1~~GGOE01000463.1.p1  ORF type:complete len:923 (+),score=102.87 GGOE01000463.1:72-2840(+)